MLYGQELADPALMRISLNRVGRRKPQLFVSVMPSSVFQGRADMKSDISTKLTTETAYFNQLIADIKKGEVKIPQF